MHIDALRIQVEILHGGHRNNRKGFIDLVKVDIGCRSFRLVTSMCPFGCWNGVTRPIIGLSAAYVHLILPMQAHRSLSLVMQDSIGHAT
jgi:hypothetical protein